MKFNSILFLFVVLLITSSCSEKKMIKSSKMDKGVMMKALIIDGENNHGVFPKTTMMMKDYLEETGLFEVEVNRTKYVWQGGAYNPIPGVDSMQQLLQMYPLNDGVDRVSVKKPKPDPSFSPDFSKYDLVVSNMGWNASTWSDETKANFEKFVSNGGGFVLTHAANNSWGDWLDYNKMIGVGGWGGRNTASGPYVYYDQEEQLQYDKSEGNCGAHGPQSEFVVTTRAKDHPIMKGLPTEWMHTKDELYEKLRGPAENLTVLATAFSGNPEEPATANKKSRTNRNEPVLMTIEYGKGRVFHTILGHMDYSVASVGFITTLQRGAEWAATGKVTQEVPSDFPSPTESASRDWKK